MQINILKSELQKRKVMVATPMYGGQCSGLYTKSSVELAKEAQQKGFTIDFQYLFNESLITRARNYLTDTFLRSNFTHLCFIDSDIFFKPESVWEMLALADPNSDKDIVCAPYPKKNISWEKVNDAALQGKGKENPKNLKNFVGDYVFNPASQTNEIKINQPLEVLEGGTGFMMIQRRVFEKYQKAYPEFMYYPDHARTEHFDGSRQICAFFDCVIEPEHKRYLSEDYMFCQWARKIGIKIWMCPWIEISHIGTYIFTGSLQHLAQIGANPTADMNEMKRIKSVEQKKTNNVVPMKSYAESKKKIKTKPKTKRVRKKK